MSEIGATRPGMQTSGSAEKGRNSPSASATECPEAGVAPMSAHGAAPPQKLPSASAEKGGLWTSALIYVVILRARDALALKKGSEGKSCRALDL